MTKIRKLLKKIDEMCKKLLVNLIIEDYKLVKFNGSSVIVFPGSNCDRDIAVALQKMHLKIKWFNKKLSA